MANKKIEEYLPKEDDLTAMKICWQNDLAYVMQPIQNSKLFHIIKFQISDHLMVHTLIENDKKTEFNNYDAGKKIMELYNLHSKRFK